MIWLLLAKDWIVARAMKVGLIGVGCVLVIGGCMVRDARIEARGGDKRQAKIEKATTNAAQLGSGAARKSAASGVRGQRDPTTRDD